MLQTLNNSAIVRMLSRKAAVWICTGLCIALTGAGAAKTAAKPSSSTASIAIASFAAAPAKLSTEKATDVLPPNGELMHELAPERESVAMISPIEDSAMTAGSEIHGTHTRVLLMEVTAYCACKKCCGPRAQGLTASGKPISYNGGAFVAADTRLLRFGTKLVIPGYADNQPVEVIDRGGAIKGYHLDVYFPTHEQAKLWGRKKLIPVTVVE